MNDLKLSGFTAHNLKEIVNEGMEKKDRSVTIFFGPAGTNVHINPIPEEAKKLDISGIATAREKIGLALLSNNFAGRSDDIREYLLKAIGHLDKFLKEHQDE